jgi:phospholipid/cholesterol/gamma-HCH transport system substrate-binding protein
MENRSHALAAGLFTIMLGLALVATFLWFGRDTIQRNAYVLVAKGSVAGLNPQAAVKYRGVEVGKVDRIRFDPDDPRNIVIDITVSAGTPLNSTTYAQLAPQGVTGLAYVALDDDPKLARTGNLPAAFEVRPSFLEQFATSGQQLVSGAGDLAGRVSVLLSPENQSQVMRTLGNIERASDRIGRIAEKAEPAIAALPGLVADGRMALKRADTLVGNMNLLVVDARPRLEAVDRITESVQGLAKTGRDLGVRSQELAGAVQRLAEGVDTETLPRVNGLIDDAQRAARNADRTIAELGDQPHALVFGREAPRPGPGEPGFDPLRTRQ